MTDEVCMQAIPAWSSRPVGTVIEPRNLNRFLDEPISKT